MANFTNVIKNEIINGKIKKNSCRKAALSAFFRTNGELTYDFTSHDYGAEFVTESEEVAEFFFSLLENLYGVELFTSFKEDRLSKREKFRFGFKGEMSERILTDLNILAPNGDFVLKIGGIATEEERLSYIRGAFLGSGSCTLPSERSGKTGYHLQFSFRSSEIASDFSDIMRGMEILAKTIEHNGSFVVYTNSKETISDFLSVIGCYGCLNELNELVEKRENSNRENRASNCEAANKCKTKSSAFKQRSAIEKIKESGQFEQLSDELKQIAQMRLSHEDYSLQRMADELSISKSCASHRMNRLLEIYEILNK